MERYGTWAADLSGQNITADHFWTFRVPNLPEANLRGGVFVHAISFCVISVPIDVFSTHTQPIIFATVWFSTRRVVCTVSAV